MPRTNYIDIMEKNHLAPQLIHQLSQVGPADMECSLQFRPTDAVFPAGAGAFEVCQQLFIAHVFSFPR